MERKRKEDNMVVGCNRIEEALWDLQRECNRNRNAYAIWILYAVSRHINTGRSTTQFDSNFVNCNKEELVEYCLHGNDYSDESFINRAKRYVNSAK